MFCSNCGKEIAENALFCSNCGKNIKENSKVAAEEVKFILDPSEISTTKQPVDSSESLSGQGKTFGLILMIISVVGDLIAMMAIGSDAFIPVTIGATALFVIGFLLKIFSP